MMVEVLVDMVVDVTQDTFHACWNGEFGAGDRFLAEVNVCNVRVAWQRIGTESICTHFHYERPKFY